MKISSGIQDLDKLIDSLYVGDNVVWEVEAGTSLEIFVFNFIRQSFSEDRDVIYVSFNNSPNTILKKIREIYSRENFVLLDCFTSGKGKNDQAFTKFYNNNVTSNIIKVDDPRNIEEFTSILNSLEDKFQSGGRYIFDSLTGMQDLWGDENRTYKIFTYICPRLYDLGTVAYWILERDAHSQKFKANLRHITQVVLELYKRKEKLYIKAVKLDGRSNREAFKPHPYEIDIDKIVSIVPKRREPSTDIGAKIREIRIRLKISQKELADKVDLTPSFISQLESNQISPSLNSFILICNALWVSPAEILQDNSINDDEWLIKKEKVLSDPILNKNGSRGYRIISNGNMSGTLIVVEPHSDIKDDFIPEKGKKLIYVLKGDIFIVIGNKGKILGSGDSIYLKEEIPFLLKNEGGDKAELLLLCS